MDIINRYRDIISTIKEPVIFEIGANNGGHTRLLLSHITSKKYSFFSFEPDHRQFANMQIKGIEFFPYAIGNFDGLTEFNLSGGSEKRAGFVHQEFTGSSSLKEPHNVLKYWPNMTFVKTEVKCMKLDTFCMQKGIDHIDFIWMDVQGAEEDVFLGGENILKNTDWIYTEYCDGELYKNEIGISQILNILSDFELVEDYNGGDALLKRKNADN